MKKYTAFILASLLTLSTVSCATDTATTTSSAVESVKESTASVQSTSEGTETFAGLGRTLWTADSSGDLSFLDGDTLYFYDNNLNIWSYSLTDQTSKKIADSASDTGYYSDFELYPSGIYAKKTEVGVGMASESADGQSSAFPSYFVNVVGNSDFEPIELPLEMSTNTVVNDGKLYVQTPNEILSYDLPSGEKTTLYEGSTGSVLAYDDQYLYFQKNETETDYVVYRFAYDDPTTVESFDPGTPCALAYIYNDELYFRWTAVSTTTGVEENDFSKATWNGTPEKIFTAISSGSIGSFQPYQDGFALSVYANGENQLVTETGEQIVADIGSFASFGDILFYTQLSAAEVESTDSSDSEKGVPFTARYFYIDEKGETHEIVLN